MYKAKQASFSLEYLEELERTCAWHGRQKHVKLLRSHIESRQSVLFNEEEKVVKNMLMQIKSVDEFKKALHENVAKLSRRELVRMQTACEICDWKEHAAVIKKQVQRYKQRVAKVSDGGLDYTAKDLAFKAGHLRVCSALLFSRRF